MFQRFFWIFFAGVSIVCSYKRNTACVIGAVWEIANLPLVQYQQKLSVRELWRNQQYAVAGRRMPYTDAWRLVATVCEVFQSEFWCKIDFVWMYLSASETTVI